MKSIYNLLSILLVALLISCTDKKDFETTDLLEKESNYEVVKDIILCNNEFQIDQSGEIKVQFIVNPSTAKFTYDSDIKKSQILLNIITTRSNSSYIIHPDKYRLENVEALKDDSGNVRQGLYTATIKDLNKMIPYNDKVSLVIKQLTKSGKEYLITSNIINIKNKITLPIIHISTPNNVDITSKEEWIENTCIKIINTDGTIDYIGENDNIRGRGNSTWLYPKKPYAIKLDKKSSVLGMPKHKRWVLLANWMDRTLIRNHVAFEISRRVGLEYTPRGKFVELVLNGEILGNYYLCEQIKVDENRLNITEIGINDVDEESITGGYLLEIDEYFDEINKFRTPIKNYPVNIKEPDEDILNNKQLEYITNYFAEIEDILYNNKQKDIAEYIDFESFAKWFILYELVGSYEPNNPKSCYMFKDRNGKLKAGPAWDFDWGTFTPGKYKFRISQALYYEMLLKNPTFINVLKECWSISKENLNDIEQFIRDEASTNEISANSNIEMWPINTTTNGDEQMSYEEAVCRMIESLNNNIKVIEKCINEL